MGTFTRDWDESTPTNLTEAHQIDDYLKYRVVDVAERLKAMFYGFTAGENSDEASVKYLNLKNQSSVDVPSSGYSRFYSKDVGGVSEIFAQNDEGDEVQLTDDGKLNYSALTIPADGIDQTHIELANDAYLVGANEAGDGDVSLIKAGRNEADDDDVALLPDAARLASNAAPTEDTQLTNKKYVDDQLAGQWTGAVAIFGTRTTDDTESNALVEEVVYKAQTDGFVFVGQTGDSSYTLVGYSDGSNPPTTVVVNHEVAGVSDQDRIVWMPVKKDDYWKVMVLDGVPSVLAWMPIGVGGCVKQT